MAGPESNEEIKIHNQVIHLKKESKIFVAGVDTLAGAALLRRLKHKGFTQVIGDAGEEPELTDPLKVAAFFRDTAPEYVFLTAGKSGGIEANRRYPAELMLHNLLVQTHVIHSAYLSGVKKLLYLASSCSYPRDCPQPMEEAALFTGPLEPTNEAYAVAKLAGIKLCQAYRQQYGVNFITAIPANIFGPGDDFSPENSHVISGLIRRMHEAQIQGAPDITIWGTGSPQRDFIYTDDLADACIMVMEEYNDQQPINLGSGEALTIAKLAGLIKEVLGFPGEIRFDPGKPDGMPVKILDCRKLKALGWQPRLSFRDALEATYKWFCRHRED